jgi:hypothetical protein
LIIEFINNLNSFEEKIFKIDIFIKKFYELLKLNENFDFNKELEEKGE